MKGSLSKNKDKVQKYSSLKGLFPGRSVSIHDGMAFGARAMLCAAMGRSPRDMSWLAACVLRGSLIMLQRFSRRVLGRGVLGRTYRLLYILCCVYFISSFLISFHV